MKPLRQLLDRLHGKFEKGGKLETLYPLYEATDTFLYTPADVTKGPSHVRDAVDLKRVMIMVVVALLPCIYMAFYNTGLMANRAMLEMGIDAAPGWRGAVISALGVGYDPESWLANMIHGGLYFIPVYLACNIAGGLCEVLFATVRRHDINEGFLVTGTLIPLTLPPAIPLWQVVVGTAFGVVIGKEVFGGTGKNFLNPALTARAFLYFAYPAELSGDSVWTAVDGFSGATPLGSMAIAKGPEPLQSITDTLSYSEAFLGTMQGSMGETSLLACLIGAVILIATGIGSWRVMAGVLIGSMGLAALFSYGLASQFPENPMFQLPPHWHLAIGSLAFGLVFMATDPVSSAMTDTGRWYYGLLIGVMTILIRVVNPAYPEGVMLAILFANVFAPLIDHFVLQSNIKRRLLRNAA